MMSKVHDPGIVRYRSPSFATVLRRDVECITNNRRRAHANADARTIRAKLCRKRHDISRCEPSGNRLAVQAVLGPEAPPQRSHKHGAARQLRHVRPHLVGLGTTRQQAEVVFRSVARRRAPTATLAAATTAFSIS